MHFVTFLALRYMRVHRVVRLRPPTNHRLGLHQHRRPLPLYGTKRLQTENNSMGRNVCTPHLQGGAPKSAPWYAVTSFNIDKVLNVSSFSESGEQLK